MKSKISALQVFQEGNAAGLIFLFMKRTVTIITGLRRSSYVHNREHHEEYILKYLKSVLESPPFLSLQKTTSLYFCIEKDMPGHFHGVGMLRKTVNTL